MLSFPTEQYKHKNSWGKDTEAGWSVLFFNLDSSYTCQLVTGRTTQNQLTTLVDVFLINIRTPDHIRTSPHIKPPVLAVF